MSERQSYWSGMSPRMKARLVVLSCYLLFSLGVFSQTPILGVVLLVVPILWMILALWISGETGLAFGPFSGSKDTLLGYSLRYLWEASVLSRVALAILGLVLVVGGLGWISTENMRAEIAKPTLTERATGIVGAAKDATSETTSGWIASAKGWFGSKESEE